MSNTFGMNSLDAICFIAHNQRWSDVGIASLTGRSKDWIASVRKGMAGYAGISAAREYDESYNMVKNMHEAEKELRYLRVMLVHWERYYRLTGSPAARLSVRRWNARLDLALMDYAAKKQIVKEHFKQVKRLYDVIPEQEGFICGGSTYARIIGSISNLCYVNTATFTINPEPLFSTLKQQAFTDITPVYRETLIKLSEDTAKAYREYLTGSWVYDTEPEDT